MKTQFRRRREGKTNYLKRKGMLKSEKARVVFRKTNKHIIAQYVTSLEAKDKVEIGVNSKMLLKYGWPKENEGSLKSLAASYLTGFLMGKKILKEKKDTPIVDLGRISPVHKSRPFAFIKGLIDSGVEIPTKKEDAFPEDERLQGKNMKKDFSSIFEKVKANIESGK